MSFAATPQADRDLRERATDIAEVLIRHTKKMVADKASVVFHSGGRRFLEERLMLQDRVLGPIPLVLTLMQFDALSANTPAAFSYDEDTGESTIYLGIFPQPPEHQTAATRYERRASKTVDKHNLKIYSQHAIATLEKQKAGLVHEVTHMLDTLRGARRMPQKLLRSSSFPKAINEQTMSAYVSTPHEFNAYFQQGVYRILNTLRGMSTRERRLTMQNFQHFRHLFLNHPDTFPLQSLSPKYQKKLDARLWQTWEYLQEQGL